MERFHVLDGPLREMLTSIVTEVYHEKMRTPGNTRYAHEMGRLIRYVLQECNV